MTFSPERDLLIESEIALLNREGSAIEMYRVEVEAVYSYYPEHC